MSKVAIKTIIGNLSLLSLIFGGLDKKKITFRSMIHMITVKVAADDPPPPHLVKFLHRNCAYPIFQIPKKYILTGNVWVLQLEITICLFFNKRF